MRVTDKMAYNQVTANLSKNRQEVADLQSQASLQKKIVKPSDDPVGAARVLGYRTEDRVAQQFIKNISMARSFLDFTDVSLGEASESLMRLKELAIQQANDAGASRETRRTVAEEVGQTFSQLVQVANRKLGERYIFGGSNTTQSPFDTEGKYHGDDAELKLHIDKDAFIAMNLSGDHVFVGKGLGQDGIKNPPAAVPRNIQELDNYEQEEHQRIQDNQNLEDHQVRVRGPADDSDRSGGVFRSEIKGDTEGVDILSTVKKFEIALRTNDKAQIQDSIDDIDQSIAQIVHARAQVGGRLQVLNHAEGSLRQSSVDNQATASMVEDVDLFTLASQMSKADSALKASLETSGKLITPSLLDFLK